MARRKTTRNAREPMATEWRQVPVLMDSRWATVILGKSPEVVRRDMASGKIPAHKIGGEWRIRKDELMAYLGYQPWEIDKYGYGLAVNAG